MYSIKHIKTLCHSTLPFLTSECARLLRKEGSLELLGFSTVLAVRKSELEIFMRVHDVLVSLQILILDNGSLDDLDRTITSTVCTSHFLIALLHSAKKSVVTILLVHVVSARTRVITQPDTVVLDFSVGFVNLHQSAKLLQTTYLVDRKNFTCTVLHLLKSVHEVPITGLGSHRVGGEKTHSVNFGLRVRFSRKSTTNDVIIVNLHTGETLNKTNCIHTIESIQNIQASQSTVSNGTIVRKKQIKRTRLNLLEMKRPISIKSITVVRIQNSIVYFQFIHHRLCF